MGTATLAARVLLALVFAAAAITKLRDPSGLAGTFRDFGVPMRLARVGSVALPPVELILATGLMLVPTERVAAIGSGILLLTFIAGIVNALSQGRAPDCGCFGALKPAPVGRTTIVRNALLVLVSVFAAVSGPGPSVDQWVAARTPLQLLLSLMLLVGVVAAIIYWPSSTAVELDPAPVTTGSERVAIGQQAPPFTLRDSAGEQRTLESLSDRGLPLVLVFGSSTCGGCVNLFPHLGRWRRVLSENLNLALIVTGDDEAVRQISHDHGLPEVLADPAGDVFRAYGLHASPSAVALTASGTVANGPAIGQDAIEDLIRLTLHRNRPTPTEWTQTTRAA